MSNYVDWQQGVVNRNFFVVQELIKHPEVTQVVLVDFLAVQSVKKVFGWKRTWDYLRSLRTKSKQLPSFTGERIGLTHSLGKVGNGPFHLHNKPVYVFSGCGLLASASSTLEQLKVALAPLGFTKANTLLWSYNAFLPEALSFPAKLKIFDAVDNWATHASYKKEAGRLIKNYQQIDRSADFVFTVSKKLCDLFNNAPTSWIPNGVDRVHFENQAQVPQDFSFKHPVVGYVGTIQERIDFDLLASVVKQHPDKSFVFIGPVWSGVQMKVEDFRHQFDNVSFIGRRSYKELPAYLQQIDVAIIPHRLDAFIHSTNPMKMYDYLAAGKPVVTTPGAGTEMFADHLYICPDKQSFSQSLDQALQDDSPAKQQARKQAVREHTWEKRIALMIHAMKTNNR